MSARELHISEEHSEAGYDRHVSRQSATEEALSQPRQPFPVTQFSSPQLWATNQAFITGPKHQNQAYSNGNPNFLLPPFQTPWSQYSLPPYGMLQTITNPQSPFPTFRQIAPKPAEENPGRAACSSGSRPPDFIETVKQIRKELYNRAGGSEDRDPPVLEGKEHSQWRKSVIDRWKPHNMTHYLMVAKLSKRCFDLVLELPQRLNRKFTQGDFIHLYNKSDDEQHQVLTDLMQKRILLQDVKRRKRGKEATPRSTETTKEFEDEISRLKSQNTDLRIKLDQALEDLDNEKKRSDRLEKRMRILERDNEDELRQYPIDVDNLLREKNDLGESFLQQSFPSHLDKMSDTSSNVSQETTSSGSDASDDDLPLSENSKTKSSEGRSQSNFPENTGESEKQSPISETSSSESETQGNLLTISERIREDFKGLKKKPTNARSSSPKKVSKQNPTSKPPAFKDEWDYDLKKLSVKEWVAVAYEEDFYVGQVDKIFSNKVRVNFLTEKEGVFSWPKAKDTDKLHAKFIFSPNLKVSEVGERRSNFTVENFQLLKDNFKAFSSKYF